MVKRKSIPLSISPSEWLNFEVRTKAFAEHNYNALKDVFRPNQEASGHCSFENSSLEFLERGLKSLSMDIEASDSGPLTIMNLSKRSRFIPFTQVLNLTNMRYLKPEKTIFAIINLLESNFAGSVVGVYALIPPRHAVAVLVWADAVAPSTFHFGIYDPQGAAGYISTGERIFTFEGKYSYDGRLAKVHTHQLSEYCPQFEKGYRCPQFYYDFQYCHMYTIQFLFHIAALIEKDQNIHIGDAAKEAVLNSLLIKSQAQLEHIGRNNSKESVVYNVVIVNIMCLFVIIYDNTLKQKEEAFPNKDKTPIFKCGVQLIADVVSVTEETHGAPHLTLPIYEYISKSSKDCKDRLGAVISYCRHLPKHVRDKMLPLFELSPSPNGSPHQRHVERAPLHQIDKILTQRLLRTASLSASPMSLRTASNTPSSTPNTPSSKTSVKVNS